tara:strand:- start:6 stop:317 length:312 start_codon:yes stop_codon:yes gene_type:complete
MWNTYNDAHRDNPNFEAFEEEKRIAGLIRDNNRLTFLNGIGTINVMALSKEETAVAHMVVNDFRRIAEGRITSPTEIASILERWKPEAEIQLERAREVKERNL